MIRKRNFSLEPHCNLSSWSSFEDIYQYLVARKADFVKTFAESAYDKNFDEPMNVLMLECDSRSTKNMAEAIKYVEKINNLFADNDKQVVIDIRYRPMPFKYKNRVHLEHTWFKKEVTFNN